MQAPSATYGEESCPNREQARPRWRTGVLTPAAKTRSGLQRRRDHSEEEDESEDDGRDRSPKRPFRPPWPPTRIIEATLQWNGRVVEIDGGTGGLSVLQIKQELSNRGHAPDASCLEVRMLRLPAQWLSDRVCILPGARVSITRLAGDTTLHINANIQEN